MWVDAQGIIFTSHTGPPRLVQVSRHPWKIVDFLTALAYSHSLRFVLPGFNEVSQVIRGDVVSESVDVWLKLFPTLIPLTVNSPEQEP